MIAWKPILASGPPDIRLSPRWCSSDEGVVQYVLLFFIAVVVIIIGGGRTGWEVEDEMENIDSALIFVE